MIRAAAQAVGQRVAAVSFISNLFRTDWHGSDDPTGDVLLFLRGFSDVKIRQKLFFQTYLSVYFFVRSWGAPPLHSLVGFFPSFVSYIGIFVPSSYFIMNSVFTLFY